MFGGFRERAESTYRLLQTPGTAFLVVAAPEADALREASYFVERLDAERMPLAGLILNRVHVSGRAAERRPEPGRSRDAGDARPAGGAEAGKGGRAGPRYELAAAALRIHAERMNLGKRERRLAEHFTRPTRPFPSLRWARSQKTCTTWTVSG